ncbi:YncE family protein [Actinocrispum wychmicini]|uniref:DNA-binding beta-propeller fold protein YncE n=1 Tax=Actinocrispum wychmicini TaxID=1213861 RepID=A0A4R2JLX5_9PSEU|nr:hypothetical protein [Actinocrispum wychmicini]TCO61051.1 hypothetical protein EV192_103634 [Actinocrispum wychmicini]
MRRLVATVTVGTALLAGCSPSAKSGDELQVSDSVTAAGPAISPATSHPAGTVVPVGANVTGIVADPRSRLLTLATDKASVLLVSMDTPGAEPRTVPLPGPATALTVTPTGVLASVGSARQIVAIALPAGSVSSVPVDGAPAGTSQDGDQTLVTLSDQKAIDVVRDSRAQRRISGGLYSADQVLTVGSNAVVLDRQRTALFDVNVNEGRIGAGQRAGKGATNATTDRYGRVLVTDTRGGGLLAFSTGPVILKQNYPVPGAPYGIAYDPKRDLAWVTLTERNEVVGYYVAGGEPAERYRFPTVVQPNSVTVDPDSGRVFVASATGGGVQVMQL